MLKVRSHIIETQCSEEDTCFQHVLLISVIDLHLRMLMLNLKLTVSLKKWG